MRFVMLFFYRIILDFRLQFFNNVARVKPSRWEIYCHASNDGKREWINNECRILNDEC